MKVEISEKEPTCTAIPRGCFLARRHSPTGPLTMLGPDCTRAGFWNAMDLEGRGGPAIGDTFSGITEEYIRENFFLVNSQVTFQNEF